jgi:hypothetical protein
LNDTDIYLSCAAVIQDYPFTNKITHECVKTCPDYTRKNEYTKFCELKLNTELDFTMIRDILLTHELNSFGFNVMAPEDTTGLVSINKIHTFKIIWDL